MPHDINSNDEMELKTRSQLKREAEALQALGEKLVELPAARFAAVMDKLALPEVLRDAIEACRAISSHGGRRRQLQYIGKLMRGIDAEPVRLALESLSGKDHAETAALHRMERWRDRLVEEGDAALAELLRDYPGADRQQLRQLAIKAHKERNANQPPTAARALFRALRELMTDAGGEKYEK